MPSIESINIRLNKIFRKKFSKQRKKKLNKYNFTIISNNCWGGMIYESYNIQKQSPTIGLFFKSSDYIKFITNFKYYISQELKFIKYDESKDKAFLKSVGINEKTNIPLGILDDIEIIFLHYKNETEAKEKWQRRVKRINYKNLIFKFNDQNGCTEKDLKNFIALPYENKVFFTVSNWNITDKCIVKIPQAFNSKFIYASHEPFGANLCFNVNKYLNNIKIEKYFEKNNDNEN